MVLPPAAGEVTPRFERTRGDESTLCGGIPADGTDRGTENAEAPPDDASGGASIFVRIWWT